jgi:hypothetical protein
MAFSKRLTTWKVDDLYRVFGVDDNDLPCRGLPWFSVPWLAVICRGFQCRNLPWFSMA